MPCPQAIGPRQVKVKGIMPNVESSFFCPAERISVTVNINLPKAADVDEVLARAEKAGARITMPAGDMFWGAYYGRLIDPFGHAWSFAHQLPGKPV